jgi:hypothetical protein
MTHDENNKYEMIFSILKQKKTLCEWYLEVVFYVVIYVQILSRGINLYSSINHILYNIFV